MILGFYTRERTGEFDGEFVSVHDVPKYETKQEPAQPQQQQSKVVTLSDRYGNTITANAMQQANQQQQLASSTNRNRPGRQYFIFSIYKI